MRSFEKIKRQEALSKLLRPKSTQLKDVKALKSNIIVSSNQTNISMINQSQEVSNILNIT